MVSSKSSRATGVPKIAQGLETYDLEALSVEDAVVYLQQLGEKASIENILNVLQKCRTDKNLVCTRRIHLYIHNQGLEAHAAIGNYLVPALADCGALPEAQQVFDKLNYRNEHSWTFLIQGCVEHGEFGRALCLYNNMYEQGVSPNRYTLQLVLKACTNLQDVKTGCKTHAEVIKSMFEGNQFVASTLVDMYVKCGLLAEAQDVFDELIVQDIVSWTALISGYAEHGPYERALDCFEQMQAKGIFPDAMTFVCCLKACTSSGAIHKGKQMHQEIVKVGLEAELFVASAMIDMYAKCVSLFEAENVFDMLIYHDVVVWNVIIAGYSEHGEGGKALDSLRKMRYEGVHPNTLTFISLLQGYDGSSSIDEVQEIHIEITKEGLEGDPLVGSALVCIYAKSGVLSAAQKVFDRLYSRNVVSWTALISGYADHGFGREALKWLKQMQADGIAPNDVTFVCSLKACGQMGALKRGKELHVEIAIEGFETDVFVGNTLVDMYARCGFLAEARDVFDELQVRDVVTWNALISRYIEHGFDEEALDCLQEMKQMGFMPDLLTYVGCLKACGCLGVIDRGLALHMDISIESFEEDSFVRSTLIDMYSRCGLLLEAQDVFDDLEYRDAVTWNVLLAGYASKGQSLHVFSLIEKMQEQGVEPNGITYLSALTACSHAGLVVKGVIDFSSLLKEHSEMLTIQHYNCMVDLLGRAGRLSDAVTLLKEIPCQPNIVTWSTLLGACRKWGDIELAKQAFESAHSSDDKYVALFISMSRIYASAHMWDDAKLIEGMRLNTTAGMELVEG